MTETLPKNATFQAVVFTLAQEQYALPIHQVREVVRMQEVLPLPQAPSFVEGVIHVRDRVIAVSDLRKRFELGRPEAPNDAHILIVRLPKALVGFVVDTVVGVFTIPQAAIQEPPQAALLKQKYLSGIVDLNGKLVFFLSASAIFSSEEQKEMTKANENNLKEKQVD